MRERFLMNFLSLPQCHSGCIGVSIARCLLKFLNIICGFGLDIGIVLALSGNLVIHALNMNHMNNLPGSRLATRGASVVMGSLDTKPLRTTSYPGAPLLRMVPTTR